MKVLFLQNQIGFEGRGRISIEIISILNSYGIIPDLLTFSKKRLVEQYQQGVINNIKCNIIRVPYPISMGFIPQVLLLNYLSRYKIDNYDLVFNFNDNFYFLPNNARYIHYFADPLEDSFSKLDNLPRFSLRKYYLLFFSLLCRHLPKNTRGRMIVISNFTEVRLLRQYPQLEGTILKIYPPCFQENTLSFGSKENFYDVVSIGTFSEGKGQLNQIKIAERHKKIKFGIIGLVFNRRYFQECLNYKISRGIQNVDLLPDITRNEMLNILKQSKVFLHYKREEGFGISTVEAIASGCIPIVPNSGGQIEVVPFPELRFEEDDEIGDILTNLLTLDIRKTKQLVNDLQQHIRQFSVERFRANIVEILKDLI